jgi:hypothetical protein
MYGQGYRFRGVVATFTATKRPAITPPLSGPEFRGRFRPTQKTSMKCPKKSEAFE